MNPTIRKLALPITLAATTVLQGCALAIPAIIQAAASDPEGTKKLAKDGIDGIKSLASAPATAASAPAAGAAPVAAKAGITAVKACAAPATSAQGQAAAAQAQTPAARAAAAKLAGGNKQLGQATQLIGVAKDATALAKDAAGAIDGSCVTMTVGRSVTGKDGSVALANTGKKTILSFNLAAPNCTATSVAGDAAGKAWASVKGAFSSDAKTDTPANTDACANDKAFIKAELDAAGKKAVATYRISNQLTATVPVTYTVQSNTVDLSSALTNAATGVVGQQVQQAVPANAGATLVRELIRK